MLPLLFLSFLLLRCLPVVNRVNALQQEGPRGWTQKSDQRPALALPESRNDKEANEKATKIPRQTGSKHIASHLKKPTDEDAETGLEEEQPGRKSDIAKKGTLSGNAHHEKYEPSSGQHSAVYKTPPANTEGEEHTSPKNAPSTKNKWLVQTILHLNYFSGLISVLSTLTSFGKKAIQALPENMRPGPDFYGFPWEAVICVEVLVLILICQTIQSVTSRLSVARQKQLGSEIAEQIEEKSLLLEKLSLCKQEYEASDSYLEDLKLQNQKMLTTISDMKKKVDELTSSNSAIKTKIESLDKELEEEKVEGFKQDDLLAETQKRKEYVENELHSVELQTAERKTILKVYEINRERLKKSLQETITKNNHLRESEKQLLQEADRWKEQVGQLSEQAKMLESSTADMEKALKDKENRVKSLTECLLKMADWSCVMGEQDAAGGSHFNEDENAETENGEHLDGHEKPTVRKLIHAIQLNARLKSLEMEKSQTESKLTDEKKAKEQLAKCAESLKKEHVMIQSENAHFEHEVQKLQEKLKATKELYQEIGMNLHRELTVEEKEHLQTEDKLSKVNENINHAAVELKTTRQRATDFEKELERTVCFYQHQVMMHVKKVRDSWLAAWTAKRLLNDMKLKNFRIRQKLERAEWKYESLKKTYYALDVPVVAFIRGQEDNVQSLPLQRPERVYSSPPRSGSLSAPADLRSYNMHFFDIADGTIESDGEGVPGKD